MKHRILCLRSFLAVALCVIMSTTMFSCGGGHHDEPDNPSIVGVWKMSFADDPKNATGFLQYEFKNNGLLKCKEWGTDPIYGPYSQEYMGTYSVIGSVLTLKFEDEDPEEFLFEIEGKKLTMYAEGEFWVFYRQ